MINKKLRQVTDTLHGTIYLSELESQMMSTPFFNRLNDVYQSSTVYLTFPSNRTKRYEHSLGTMELTGQMLFSSIHNSSVKDRERFFTNIAKTFFKFVNNLGNRKKAFYSTVDLLDDKCPKSLCDKDSVMGCINRAIKDGAIGDMALEHSAICFNNIGMKAGEFDEGTVSLYSYLYQCVLQASRIAALFHDVGHPPYSHIVEDSLRDLYNQVKADKKKARKGRRFVEAKADLFLGSLEPFVEKGTIPDLIVTSKKNRPKGAGPFALHEQIGLKILSSAFTGIVGGLLREIDMDQNEIGFAKALYYITIIEFAFAIMLESTPEMKVIHRIISGPVDADRLDYIMRDSCNSGVNWGVIPYKRIVASSRLIYKDRSFQIAFPQKMTGDLEDLLICRYKIFTRINYHHRSVKTASLLKAAVFYLANDYLVKDETDKPESKRLKNPKAEIISPEIKNLWASLDDAFGQNAVERKMAQWNDSWLISVFTNALIKLSDSGVRSRLIYEKKGITKEHLEYILNLLEEVLLNKKSYYSMVKRQDDAHDLMDMIAQRINLNHNIQVIMDKELKKLAETRDNKQKEDAREGLQRIQELSEIIHMADFDRLDRVFPLEGGCEGSIRKALDQSKGNGVIADYIIEKNIGRKKHGISDYRLHPEDTIFLYTPHKTFEYDVEMSLLKQLRAISLGCPWLFVYIKVDKAKAERARSIIEEQKKVIAERISDDLTDVFSSLFNHQLIIGS